MTPNFQPGVTARGLHYYRLAWLTLTGSLLLGAIACAVFGMS